MLTATACGSSGGSASVKTSSGGSASDKASAGASGSNAATASLGHLTFGTSGGFPPANFKDSSGNIVGYEADMVKWLSQHMGFTYNWKQINFDGLIPALQSGRLDAIVSGVYDTPERRKVLDLYDYNHVPLSLITKKGDTATTKSPLDVCGKTIAILLASPSESGTISQWNKQCKAAGKSSIKTATFQTDAAAVAAVENGRAFGQLEADIVSLYIASTNFGGNLATAFPVPPAIPTALVVKKNSKLSSAFKAGVAAYVASPQYCIDAKKWFLTAGDLLRSCS